MRQFNHVVEFAAEVFNGSPDSVAPAEARKAIIERANRLSDDELIEAINILETT